MRSPGRRRREDRQRFCEYCGRQLHRKRYPKGRRLEDRAVFRRRRFCDRDCYLRESTP